MQRKKIGLALGSGGWRGQAHVGVIKALTEAGIRIDCIAGTSIGAMVGGIYAAKNDVAILEDFFLNKINKRNFLWALSDPRLKSGILKGKKFMEVFEKIVGQYEIENLKIPFCAVASDLITGKLIEINSGSLTTAVRASTSVPFLFRPVKYKNCNLIDGGTIMPIPVEVAKNMKADVVIAVNLYKNIFPIENKKVTTLEALLKTSHVMLSQLAKNNLKTADIVIEPNIKETKVYSGPLDGFMKTAEMIKIGEDAVKEKLKEIQRLLN